MPYWDFALKNAIPDLPVGAFVLRKLYAPKLSLEVRKRRAWATGCSFDAREKDGVCSTSYCIHNQTFECRERVCEQRLSCGVCRDGYSGELVLRLGCEPHGEIWMVFPQDVDCKMARLDDRLPRG